MITTCSIIGHEVRGDEDLMNQIENLNQHEYLFVFFDDHRLASMTRDENDDLSVLLSAEGNAFLHMIAMVDDPALIQAPGFFEAYRDRYIEALSSSSSIRDVIEWLGVPADSDMATFLNRLSGATKGIEIPIDDDLLAFGKRMNPDDRPPMDIDELRDMASVLRQCA